MAEHDALGARLAQWMHRIAEAGLDGWLIADFRWNNPLFAKLLDLHTGILTRRCFLWLPAYGQGEPLVLASQIDGHTVSTLPCPVRLYRGYEEMSSLLHGLLPAGHRVAMEYVEHGLLPTISRVDAGLVELVRSFGAQVVSSSSLIAALEVWDETQRALHLKSALAVDEARRLALKRCGELLRRGERVTEGLLAQVISAYFDDHGFVTGGDPDVGVDAHSADPHYSLGGGEGAEITANAVLLIDLWAKVRDAANAPFADSTWMSYTGPTPPADVQHAFTTARQARDAAIDHINTARASGVVVTGREVDQVTRAVILAAGLGDHLMHRTGHSLGADHTHGMGTNLDDIEFPDDRPLLPWCGFTVEPGLYWPGRFGIRLEVSAILLPDRVQVTTESQQELTLIT